MFTPEEVGAAIQRRRAAIRQLWHEQMENGIVYREVEAAVQSMGHKGYEVMAARQLLARGEALFQAGNYDDLQAVIAEINHSLRQARRAGPGDLPADLPALRAGWPPPANPPALDPAAWHDKVLGGWLGKNIGCALGGHLEGWSRQSIAEQYGFVEDFLLKPPATLNDDIAFEIILLHALEQHGLGLTSAQLGWEWTAHLLPEYCYTAEKAAIANLLRGVAPPESGSQDNPFSEWVGGQMKGEVCGLIAPGRPDLAAEYAYRDGIVAHDGEGLYGEIFSAAATSAAFFVSDPAQVIEIALQYVPGRSQYAAAIRQAVAWCREAGDWQAACERLEQTLGREYYWVHVLPNAAVVVIALLFGQGDFTRTAGIATGCGFDVDTNGGVAGAIAGVMCGAGAIPRRLSSQIGDEIDTWVVGFERVSLADLTRRTCQVGRQLLAARS